MLSAIVVAATIFAGLSSNSAAESVAVKYRGAVDLSTFDCQWHPESSFVNRTCYDKKAQYALVSLNGVYYHYCEVPSRVVADWRAADSKGRFYNSAVKGRFDCRLSQVPSYDR